MKIRKLELKDDVFMLEWMHDRNVTKNMRAGFSEKTISDCKKFILSSYGLEDEVHLAVVDENDQYMGTVSLKNIDREKRNAEFAIILRTIAMGKGYSRFAMDEIMKIGFEKYGLNQIYWCVSKENIRAIRFYDKKGYDIINPEKLGSLNYEKNEVESYIWYLEQRK